jgi:uncharacterized protein
VILVDAGPLVALLDQKDPYHAACAASAKGLSGSMLTTWPCLTEAMYLLQRFSGFPGQAKLWAILGQGKLLIHSPGAGARIVMETMMRRYQNVPMDFADASLIEAAEATGIRVLFTVDSDFVIYRLQDGSSLQLVP